MVIIGPIVQFFGTIGQAFEDLSQIEIFVP